MAQQILIVDGQPSVDAIEVSLQDDDSIDVVSAATGREALAAVGCGSIGAVVMEVDLTDASGFDVAASIRRQRPDVPIIFLTTRHSDADKLAGFSAGADDYIVKPFNPPEFVARLHALMRRTQPQTDIDKDVFHFGRFEIRPEEGRLLVGTEEVSLPAREFQLLCFLAKHRDVVFSVGELYAAVWKSEALGATDSNTVSVHIHRLRAKIEPAPSKPHYLITVRGLGYKLVQPDAVAGE